MRKKLFIFFTLVLCIPLLAQNTDSLSRSNDSISKVKAINKKNYSEPRKASIMSAVLPGLGQAYNKKYWKLPIIYAGLGGFTYMFITNNEEYKFYRKNLIAANDDDPDTDNTTRYSSDQLQVQKVAYRKNRDFAVIGIAVIYILNIIDANVDAHLKTFDVSDDLSLNVAPWHSIYGTAGGYRTATGLSLKLTFK